MNQQIYEEASEWLVELRTEKADIAVRRRFLSWLESSPEHVRAYLELAGVWEAASAGDPANEADIESLIERAQTVSNIVPLAKRVPKEQSARAEPAGNSRRTSKGLVALAASVVALAGIGTLFFAQRNAFSTAVGEQRSILLSDGSTVELNARSVVKIRFDDAQRNVELLSGQALFHVAKDKSRPFIVRSRATTIRAVGTQFDVNQRKRGTIVTVVEGTVAVTSGSEHAQRRSTSPIAPVILGAGERAVLTIGAVPKPQPADAATATAWTKRRLIFDSTPLAEVAEEFNRNNIRPLVIANSGLEGFHVSGAFSSSDPQPLLRFLRAQSGIEIEEHEDRIVVSLHR